MSCSCYREYMVGDPWLEAVELKAALKCEVGDSVVVE